MGVRQYGFLRWHGDVAACRAAVNDRTRLLSGVARAAFKLHAEVVERGFALTLDRGDMRRAWLRGGENLHKRYRTHVADFNVCLIIRPLIGAGAPREFHARAVTITIWSHQLLRGFNAAYNARRQRVLAGKTPDQVVAERLKARRKPANAKPHGT